jgi:hypothetical protein
MSLLSKSQIKNANDKVRTLGMFYEMDYKDTDAVLSIKPNGPHLTSSGKELHSIHDLYMQHCIDDPTEYTLAIEVFGEWKTWEKISSNTRNQDEWLTSLRNEAIIARKAMAFKSLVKDAKTGTGASAKYLIEEPWKKGAPGADGRKKRAQVRDTANKAFQQSGVSEDVQRLKDDGYLQ